MAAEESKNDDKKADKEGEIEEVEAEEVASEGAELKDRILRMAAEFDNYKKRVAKDIDNSKEAGRADVISKLLPTVDEFELAINSFDKKDEHLKGISLIYSNLMSTLRGFGLREIQADGKFDPYKHETMLVQESDEEDGKIVKVVRKGYMLNTIMLRPASVIIAKSKAPQEGEKKENEKKSE